MSLLKQKKFLRELQKENFVFDGLGRVVIRDESLCAKINGATFITTGDSNDNAICPHMNPYCVNTSCVDAKCLNIKCH
jgi:hypothetical protein